MKAFLDRWLPRAIPGLHEKHHFVCYAHQGRNDLERQLVRRLRAWKEPDTRFIVLRDNDSHPDCKGVKHKLSERCAAAGRSDAVVRVVCQELEAWFLGDLDAAHAAFPECRFNDGASQRDFRAPDTVRKPSREFDRRAPRMGKVTRARAIADHFDHTRNTSPSFRVFFESVRRLAVELGHVT